MFKSFKVIVLMLFLVVFKINDLKSQSKSEQYGKEFIFNLLENLFVPNRIIFAVNSETIPNRVKIVCVGNTIFDNWVYSKDTQFIYTNNINSTPNASFFNPTRSVFITCSNNAALSVLNSSQNSSDVSTITPTEWIPKNPVYYVNTYRGIDVLSLSNNGLFSIVALEDNCNISILPSADSKTGLNKGIVFNIRLNKGQVYRTQSSDSQSFAGTKIWNNSGCKKFAVFEGAMCSDVEYNNSSCRGCDHLYAQSTPLQYLGKKYTTVPFANNNLGYIYQIVATQNNTQIKINNVVVANLNETEVYRGNTSNNISLCIEANHPISVSQLMKSGGCNGHPDNLGNPSLMNLIPDNQTISNFGFSFFTTQNISPATTAPGEFFLSIVANVGQLSSIRLNGRTIDTTNFNVSCNKSVGFLKLNANTKYDLKSNGGIIAYLYANGKDESYATAISKGIVNTQTELSITDGLTSTCDSFFNFNFKAKSDSLALFSWNFGDGSSAQGDSVFKIYNQTGVFKVALNVKYTNNVGCVDDTLYRTISIFKRPYFDFGKDTTLCFGQILTLKPFAPQGVNYQWSNGSTKEEIVINNPQKVVLKLKNADNCEFSDTINVNFKSCDSNYYVIPNVFSPIKNIDGLLVADNFNDEFEVKMVGYDVLNGYIYNRWGQLVYEFEYPKDNFWNGGYNNDISKPCSDGTYYYIMEFKNSKTNLKSKANGVIRLMR